MTSPTIVATEDLTGQTAPIASTVLFTTTTAAIYTYSMYMIITAADVTASSLFASINGDNGGGRGSGNANVSGEGVGFSPFGGNLSTYIGAGAAASGTMYCAAGTDITYLVNCGGTCATYDLHISLVSS